MRLITNLILLTFLCFVSSKKSNDHEDNTNVILSFSLPSGFYNENSIQLEIKSSHPDVIIYYTLDGHNPTENSTVYEKPLTFKNKSEEENVYCMIKDVAPKYKIPIKKVNKANIIRAIAKLPDGTFSNIYSGSYFVGLDKKKLYGNTPVISLITDPDNLFDYEKGIYTLGKAHDDWLAEDPENINAENYQVVGNYNGRGKNYERPGTFQYIPGDKTYADFTQDIGFRIKGNTSRSYFQKSLRLISRAEYGKKSIKYDLLPGNQRSDRKGPITKYKSFSLRNSGNDFKYSKIRDSLLQSLISNDKFENQRSDVSVVYLDGEFWGIYFICEEYDEEYIANNYDIDDKNVAIIKNSKNIEAGSQKDLDEYNEMINFITDNDMSIPSNYDKASKLLDIEGYAWTSAFYIYTNSKDNWFTGDNYAMWRVNEPISNVAKANGKWYLMMFDTEFSTGLYGDGSDYDEDTFQIIFNSTEYDPPKLNTVITQSLLKNDKYKNMLVNALCDMKNINFENNRVNQRLENLRSKVVPLIDEAYDRYQEFHSAEGEEPIPFYNKEVNYLKTWLDNRPSVFINQIKSFFNFKSSIKVTIKANDFNMGSIIVNNFNTIKEKYTGEYFNENILYVTGKPADGKKLKSWNLLNCNLVSNHKKTIGIYPKKGCTITANFA